MTRASYWSANTERDIESSLIKANQPVDSKGVNSTSSTGGIAGSSFLASKMIFALNKQFEPDLGHLNYHLTEFGKMKLLTVALSKENNHFFCVSMDL